MNFSLQPPLCLAAPTAPYSIFLLSQTGSTPLGGLASFYSMQADGNACNDDELVTYLQGVGVELVEVLALGELAPVGGMELVGVG